MPGTFGFPASRPACIRGLLSALVVLLIIGPYWSANPAAAAEPEVGGETSAPSGLPWDGPLGHEIEVGLNWMVLSDDDMNDTYDSLPVFQVRLSVQAGRQARFFMGAGYGQTDGDPYYDDATFDWDDDARLKVVPIQMGIRFNLEPREDFRLNLGFFFEGVWVQETLPAPYLGYDEDQWEESGWSHGVGMTFGPEWRSHDLGWGIGFEGGVTGNSGMIGKAPSHDVNLSGMSGRLYFTTRI